MKVDRQFQQEGHCGPTCVSMLLSAYDELYSQTSIASAAGVSATIAKNGSRIDQLAQGVSVLAPDYVVMGKFDSDLNLIEQITNDLRLAVGVEWQGCFRRDDGTTFDIGHFSLITGVDWRNGSIELVDPDASSVYSHGSIRIADFLVRWWEDNELVPGKKSRSFRLAFVVDQRRRADTLRALGLVPVTYELVSSSSIDL